MEQKIKALQELLEKEGHSYSLERFKVSPHQDNLILVNERDHKYGPGPGEAQADAMQLREDLVRIFGEEAEGWTSDFLRLQQRLYEDLRPALEQARSVYKKKFAALPLIPCDPVRSGFSPRASFPIRAEMFQGTGEFRVPIKSYRVTYAPLPKFTPEKASLYTKQLDEVAELKAKVDRLEILFAEYKSYVVLNKAIKDSFNWNRLPNNQHDNETAHAYQAIVNPLHHLISKDSSHLQEYQTNLRLAFDGKLLLPDNRRVDTKTDAEYLVLTKEEVDIAVRDNIRESVWAFVPAFLRKFIKISERSIVALQTQGEEANEPLLLLLGDRFDEFVDAAIAADGRGHFLSSYDGKELRSWSYYIYCQNRDFNEH